MCVVYMVELERCNKPDNPQKSHRTTPRVMATAATTVPVRLYSTYRKNQTPMAIDANATGANPLQLQGRGTNSQYAVAFGPEITARLCGPPPTAATAPPPAAPDLTYPLAPVFTPPPTGHGQSVFKHSNVTLVFAKATDAPWCYGVYSRFKKQYDDTKADAVRVTRAVTPDGLKQTTTVSLPNAPNAVPVQITLTLSPDSSVVFVQPGDGSSTIHFDDDHTGPTMRSDVVTANTQPHLFTRMFVVFTVTKKSGLPKGATHTATFTATFTYGAVTTTTGPTTFQFVRPRAVEDYKPTRNAEARRKRALLQQLRATDNGNNVAEFDPQQTVVAAPPPPVPLSTLPPPPPATVQLTSTQQAELDALLAGLVSDSGAVGPQPELGPDSTSSGVTLAWPIIPDDDHFASLAPAPLSPLSSAPANNDPWLEGLNALAPVPALAPASVPAPASAPDRAPTPPLAKMPRWDVTETRICVG